MATKPFKSGIKSCQEILSDLKTTTLALDSKIKITHDDEIHKRLVSAKRSILEAVVQINVVESQLQAEKGK